MILFLKMAEMDDKDKSGAAETDVPYDHITSRTRLLETISQQVRDTEDAVGFVASPAIKTKTPAIWTQRVFSWFKRN